MYFVLPVLESAVVERTTKRKKIPIDMEIVKEDRIKFRIKYSKQGSLLCCLAVGSLSYCTLCALLKIQ